MIAAFVADPPASEERDTLADVSPAMPPLVLRTATKLCYLLADAGSPASARTGRSGLSTGTLHRQQGTAGRAG